MTSPTTLNGITQQQTKNGFLPTPPSEPNNPANATTTTKSTLSPAIPTTSTGAIVPPPGTYVVEDDEKRLPPVVYEGDTVIGPGLLRDDVYDSQMSWWRAGIRRVLVRNLAKESEWIGAMQERIRTPMFDTYFVYTSTLGTHTFFMTMLPAFFFFGHDEAGRSLVHVLGMGVYIASLIKDSICSPRPFAPPVTRLTIGSHHLEYGFPSTHSTNSISIALHFHSIFYSLFKSQSHLMPKWGYVTSVVGLLAYAGSIVFGRLYCGMHSFTDCAAGVTIGTLIWAAQWIWGPLLDQWFSTPGWQVPLISIPLTLILVNQHPDPVDDCPCFEDAIAFLSVILGTTLAMWWRENSGYGKYSGFFVQEAPKEWIWWTAAAGVKMVIGVLIIFIFRLVAKPILHAILPPIFRGLSTLFTLPNRRFYTPATDYNKFPSESILNHPIPSMIDLPSMNQESEGVLLPTNNGAFMGRKRGRSMYGGDAEIKMRNGVNGTSNGGEKGVREVKVVVPEKEEEEEEVVKVKHYDAEVLTKVIVYAGIGFVASGLTPVMFEMIGLGVYQSVPVVRS